MERLRKNGDFYALIAFAIRAALARAGRKS